MKSELITIVLVSFINYIAGVLIALEELMAKDIIADAGQTAEGFILILISASLVLTPVVAIQYFMTMSD